MPSLRLSVPRANGPQVLSLNVQAALPAAERRGSQFELLLRHLFDRLLNNEAFGPDAAVRVTQLVYAVALPIVLVALFLFPAYHQPHAPRPYWSQAADHLFYVTYSFVILGLATIFQWELLFPDLLDVYILTGLPILRWRLLLARVLALALFLALVHLGTSTLGALFLPGVADIPGRFWRHLLAHVLATSASALFITVALVALQAALVCLPQALAVRISSAVRALSVVVLLTVLFLFPITAHLLSESLLSHPAARWFPPFWFLGLYERVLYGASAPAPLAPLARVALFVTCNVTFAALALYPVAYSRRVRTLVEGTGVRQGPSRLAAWRHALLARFVVRSPGDRALFYFAAQTLLRLPRLQLYLAMYAGLGIALVLSGLVVFHGTGSTVHLVLSPDGARMAVPVLAFWVVAGLRTALASPLSQRGAWLFRVTLGLPTERQLRGPARLVALTAALLCLFTVALLQYAGPPEIRSAGTAAAQILVAVGLSVLLTDLFFLNVRSVPFTGTRHASPRQLPLTLVQYFVLFPAFALAVVQREPWLEQSSLHLALTACACALAHVLLLRLRAWLAKTEKAQEDPLFLGLGLRET